MEPEISHSPPESKTLKLKWIACTFNQHHMCRGFHSSKCNCATPPKPCGCNCHSNTIVVNPKTKEIKMTELAAVVAAPVLTPTPTVAPTATAPTESITVESPKANVPVPAAPTRIVLPKAVKAPWKCSDCTGLIYPSGIRGRPAKRCNTCKAKIAQAKADEAAAKAAAVGAAAVGAALTEAGIQDPTAV